MDMHSREQYLARVREEYTKATKKQKTTGAPAEARARQAGPTESDLWRGSKDGAGQGLRRDRGWGRRSWLPRDRVGGCELRIQDGIELEVAQTAENGGHVTMRAGAKGLGRGRPGKGSVPARARRRAST